MSFIKEFTRHLAGLLAPVLLIVIGGSVIGAGITFQSNIILIIGLCLLIAGIIWGAFLLYY